MPGMVLNDSHIEALPSKGHANGFSNGVNGHAVAPGRPLSSSSETLMQKFVKTFRDLEAYKSGKPVLANGQTLSIAAVAAAARHGARVVLDDSREIKEKVRKSRAVVSQKVDSGASVYGLSTGFGGSADTRTDQPLLLGQALLQHQHAGVLPSSDEALEALPLLDPGTSTTMPESWVRAAMLIRINSLIRGHSGVRWELIEKINELMDAHITPAVPIRGSISASGDLSPLSYIAGSLVGNPSIRVFDGPKRFGQRKMVSSCDALKTHNITPIVLASKEPLGILNGTAFSAGVASLALNDAIHLAMLAQVCTAMGTEALLGTSANYDPFLHDVTRPHPGQVEVAANIRHLLEGTQLAQGHEADVKLEEDKHVLRQDRYPLRTAPQFIGPQIEDLLAAYTAVTQECNSTTDNPLIDGDTGIMHHGGNFQAMAVTNAMEKTRLSLHHIGKILFAQSTELVNPAMNNGLPPSVAATDPNLNYHTKGVDIATAAYVAELGYLATPVSTHIQSAEMHNQAVNSLALISARATINSLEVLSMLTSSYLYILCQALDLRALRREFDVRFNEILLEELSASFGIDTSSQPELVSQLRRETQDKFDKTSTMDNFDQMRTVAASCTTMLVDHLSSNESTASKMTAIPSFRSKLAERSSQVMSNLRHEYLSGGRGPAPAASSLGKTRAVYTYVRETLGIRMHGVENNSSFAHGLGVDDQTIGQNISLIHESIRDGKMQKVVADLFA